MNATGIDVSKGKSMVTVLRPLGVVVAKPFEVGHTAAELGKLADFLKSLDGETKVVMEHTGRYDEPVAQVIHDRGLSVSAVNPLLIREYGCNSLRRVKNDKADAKKIARYGLDNWAELREHTPMDTIRYELKTLNRQFHLASKNRTACSNNLVTLLDLSFSGASGVMGRGFFVDAIANIEGLPAVNQDVCKQQMAENQPPARRRIVRCCLS